MTIAALLWLLSCPAPPARAQEASAGSEGRQAELKRLSLEDLLQVRVSAASRREERAAGAPATVIVVSRRELRERGYSTLTDVLRDLPGMETIEFYFSEFGTQVPVRGVSGNNKIVVLVNGMRVNPPGGESFPLRSDFSVRDAEAIEVVYGPGSTLYGPDAISAVIDVKTREPAGDLAGQAGAGGGPRGEREAWGALAKTFGARRLAFSGFLQYHDSDLSPFDREFPAYWRGYADAAAPKGAGLKPLRRDFGANAFGRLELGGSSLQVWHRRSLRSSAEGFTPVLGFLEQAKWGDQSSVVEGRNTLSLTEALRLESAAAYNQYEIDPRSRYVTPKSATEWRLDDFKYGIGKGLSLEETLHAEAGERLTLLGGGAVTYADIVPKATIPGGLDGDRPAVDQQGATLYYSRAPGGPLTPVPAVSRVRYWTYAGFLEGSWQTLERLRLTAGARVTRDDRFERTPVTPRAALVYDLSDRWTAKYVFTQAYAAPAPYFGLATFDNGVLLATTNPDLRPETAESHEVALDYRRPQARAVLSAYHRHHESLILVSDRAAPQSILGRVFLNGDPAQPRTLVHAANGGRSTSQGLDLFGNARLGPLRPWFSYSLVRFEETNAQVSGLPGASRHNGRLGVTWEAGRLTVTPSLVARSTPENVDPAGLKIGSPYEVNLFVLYEFARRLELFGSFRNITDNHYGLGGFVTAMPGGPVRAVPQETFHGLVGLRGSF